MSATVVVALTMTTEQSGYFGADVLKAAYAAGSHRPARQYQPGWWLLNGFTDGTWAWEEITLIADAESIALGESVRRLALTDPSMPADEQADRLSLLPGDDTPRTLTAADAKRVGLTGGAS